MKKLFLLLFSLFVWFLTFCSADDFTRYTWTYVNIRSNQTFNFDTWFCSIFSSDNFASFDFYKTDWTLITNWSSKALMDVLCFDVPWYVLNTYWSTLALQYSYILNSCDCPECEICPEIDTWSILSWSCDTNYCVENDLCPVPSNFSQLFVNDIEFPWKPLINVNIPDYITWDYSSSDTGFDLYVGSGYDEDYINSIVDINSYRPTSEDFTTIFVSGLTLIFPYLIFTLFLVFMWKLIKRIFKH